MNNEVISNWKSILFYFQKRFIDLNVLFFFYNLYRERLYSGIAKDVQRQQQHKIENTFILQQQLQLAKKLKAEEENELQTKVKG